MSTPLTVMLVTWFGKAPPDKAPGADAVTVPPVVTTGVTPLSVVPIGPVMVTVLALAVAVNSGLELWELICAATSDAVLLFEVAHRTAAPRMSTPLTVTLVTWLPAPAVPAVMLKDDVGPVPAAADPPVTLNVVVARMPLAPVEPRAENAARADPSYQSTTRWPS